MATTIIVDLAALALISLFVAVRRTQSHDISVKASAILAADSIETNPGHDLVKRFESLRGIPFSVRDGFTVFMFGSWKIEGRIDPECQTQLAVNSPNGWHLVDWTSDQKLVNGTINSWGTIQKERSYLREYRDTLTLVTVATGSYALAWQPPKSAHDTSTLKAKIVYACGNSDHHPSEFDVTIDQPQRR
ncbi:hypothetical protein AB0H83_00320 [Dactylosporangium sp. NPDC050688]|uniref:hypothetical protein n=1 Tax=Dactylosporangium sp. NPDC050688 TaxID=3157217 RepID=UPI00340BE551